MKNVIKLVVLFCCALQLASCNSDDDGVYHGDVYLMRQSEVDALASKHIKRITGFLTITRNDEHGLASIHDLSGLAFIEMVDKGIEITNTDSLRSLHGLEKLRIVGELINIAYNYSLENINALTSLTSAGGIAIVQNRRLSSLEGIENVSLQKYGFNLALNPMVSSIPNFNFTTITGDLTIQQNGLLQHLSGLQHLTNVKGGVYILYSDGLKDLDGLNNLETVDKGFVLRGFVPIDGIETEGDDLASIAALKKLTTVNSDFEISGLNKLTSTEGLEGLASVGGNFSINDNPSLNTLEGLIDLSSVAGVVTFHTNVSLAQFCALKPLAQHHTDEFIMLGNAENPTRTEIIQNCN